jgi:DNA-binding transcriptional MerR regulator
MVDKMLTIQEVAAATGLSEHTLRYYERIGLIHSIARADNGHRRYEQADVDWVVFLTKLRAAGMSIRQMQAYAELQRQGDETLPERVEMLKAVRRHVEAQIDELSEHHRLLDYKIEFYSDLVKDKERC